MNRSMYFTKYTHAKGILYTTAILYVLLSCIVVTIEPFLNLPCPLTIDDFSVDDNRISAKKNNNTQSENYSKNYSDGKSSPFENPAYNANPCRDLRYSALLYLTVEECSFARRILSSVLFGGIIGWERRQADRPAGIRTMSLVALGSCLFSITSAFAFLDGPMNWDGSRVAAAIPSGVGFLGAGLIWKQAEKDEDTGESSHVVHGLTTAASLWLSAAVGIACGGELYFSASFSVAVMLIMLRFGPRVEHEHVYSDVGHPEEQAHSRDRDEDKTVNGQGHTANQGPDNAELTPLYNSIDQSSANMTMERQNSGMSTHRRKQHPHIV